MNKRNVMEWVYNNYYAPLLQLTNRLSHKTGIDAEDIAVQAIYKFSENYHENFDKDKNHISLIYTIAKNQFKTELKNTDRRSVWNAEFLYMEKSSDFDFEGSNDLLRLIDDSLPNEQMKDVFMSHMNEYDIEEISVRQELNASQVQTILGISKKILKGSSAIMDFLK